MMREFSTASMDLQTKIFTLIFGGISLVFPFLIFFVFKDAEMPLIAKIIVSTVLLTALVSSYLLIPKISLGNGNIYIKNYFVTIKIPIQELVGIKLYERVGMNFRTFGVGGVFGYFGYFNGNDVWYVTNIHKKIKIQTSKKLYMISPENPEEFLKEVQEIRKYNS